MALKIPWTLLVAPVNGDPLSGSGNQGQLELFPWKYIWRNQFGLSAPIYPTMFESFYSFCSLSSFFPFNGRLIWMNVIPICEISDCWKFHMLHIRPSGSLNVPGSRESHQCRVEGEAVGWWRWRCRVHPVCEVFPGKDLRNSTDGADRSRMFTSPVRRSFISFRRGERYFSLRGFQRDISHSCDENWILYVQGDSLLRSPNIDASI